VKKIWILAGESSGDMYGARVGQELRRMAEESKVELALSGMGGKRMIEAGIPVRVDSTELGVIGLFEISKLLFKFIGIFFSLVRAARRERPDVVVLIDYPGFNLLFALAMYFSRIKVVWYVIPQLWAWGKWRKPVLARICKKILVIFPFEEEVFAGTPCPSTFVGHPLTEIIAEKTDPSIKRDPDLFLLLPGSRAMEVTRLLPSMLECVEILHKKHPELKFRLSAAREKMALLSREIETKFRKTHPGLPPVEISCGDNAYCRQAAGTGLAASGTVTVECAISGLPIVVGYRLNWVTILLASLVIKLYRGFFTMTNIIANRVVYPEFLQHHFCPKELIPAIEAFLPGGARRAEVEAGMREVREMLNPGGVSAIHRAAAEIWSCVEKE